VQAIKFRINGFMNSFRDPNFVDYHRTLLFPPKTTIVGLIVNTMGLEKDSFYELQDEISVGIIIEAFLAKGFDLWSVRKGKEKEQEHVTQPIQREFLFKSQYIVYVLANQNLLDRIEDSLKMPRRYYSLGRDDELIEIKEKEIKKVKLERSKEKEFGCVLPFDVYKYRWRPEICGNIMIPPEIVKLPLRFEEGRKGRVGKDIRNFTQFYGIKIILDEEIGDNCFKVDNKENIVFF